MKRPNAGRLSKKALTLWGLKAAISKALKALVGLPGASPGQVEDVRSTLEAWKKGTTPTSYPPFPTSPTTTSDSKGDDAPQESD